ncbi:MAG: homoserine dehydrogenase [Alphaproteobacteria bacterium]
MSKALRVGIAGLGTVGAAVLQLVGGDNSQLTDRAGRPIKIVAVSARDRAKDRGVALDGFTWFDDPVAMATKADIDILVELIGGHEGVAKAAVEAALTRGIPVVSANKALLAVHGQDLARLAEQAGVTLGFEAAVAGGIPIVKALRESLAGNNIRRVYGILNGTCNYILTVMEREGREFADVLAEAQKLGYAEADPKIDIGGGDTAHKLALLTSLAFGTEVDFASVYVEGIEAISAADIAAADALGYRIKLLGVAQRTESGIEQRVHPTMVAKGSPIAEIGGVYNAVVVDGDFVGEVMLSGRGAGGMPTASAVVGDIVDIARGQAGPVFGRNVASMVPFVRSRMRAHEGGYFALLSVFDQPGAMAAIAMRLSEQNISIQSMIQGGPGSVVANQAAPTTGKAPVPLMLITHETTEVAIRTALEQIERDGHISGQPRMIRIEPA